MSKPVIVDHFCGAGGESAGLMAACKSLGMDVDLHAVNHWERAIETHTVNHPDASHYCESIQNLDPCATVPGGRVALMWASPECTHHSNARGGRPCSDQSRASAWLILKWLSELYVERVIIENVPEFLGWGPLGANGRPLPSKRGETFRAWCDALKSLGYTVDYRVINAADFGAPTTRRRLFVQAVRGRKRIAWPEPSHSEQVAQLDLFTDHRKPWTPASDVIDWELKSQSIFERKRPLAAATIRRIEAGIERYWGELAEPFLVVLRGTGKTRRINVPLPTVTAGGGHLGLVEPLIIPQHGGGFLRPVSRPLPTVATRGAIGMVEPFLVQYYGNGDARSIKQPLDTVTCRDRFALVDGSPASLDIRFRMLQPHELAAAQSFPSNYIFTGNKTEQVKQIGNAVPPAVAQALAAAVLAA